MEHYIIKDNRQEFTVLKTIQKYVLYESHNSLGYNGTTSLYQFLKKKYYWKHLKETVQNLADIVYNVKQLTYKHQIMCNVISPFETTMKGNQYASNVICMLSNYIICIPIPDKSADIVVHI